MINPAYTFLLPVVLSDKYVSPASKQVSAMDNMMRKVFIP